MFKDCIHLNKYINQDVVLNSMKATPDHSLKNLILTGIYEGYSTLPSLREYVRITPYIRDGEENFYTNESGLSSGINYLKSRLWITIYPKDEMGRPIKKPAPTRPYVYYLNELAYKYLSNPWGRMEYKDQVLEERAAELARLMLEDSDQFREAVERRAKEMKSIKITNRIEKPVLEPINQTIKIMDDGVEKVIELDSNGKIKELGELKNQLKQQEANHTATIQEYQKYVRELESTLSKSDIEAVKKFERNLTKEEKIQHRYALANEYWNNGYYLDEYFFQQWGGDYIIVILKKLMEFGQLVAPESIDVFSRSSDLYKRRKSRIKRIVAGGDILSCEIVIIGTTESGLVIDSSFLEAEKTLKW